MVWGRFFEPLGGCLTAGGDFFEFLIFERVRRERGCPEIGQSRFLGLIAGFKGPCGFEGDLDRWPRKDEVDLLRNGSVELDVIFGKRKFGMRDPGHKSPDKSEQFVLGD